MTDTDGDSAAEASHTVGGLGTGIEVRRDRLLLWAVAALVTAALAYVVWRYVGTVVLGLFVYYVTRPVFERIHARVPSRGLAVGVSLLTVALPVLLLVGWTVAVAVQALSSFISNGGGGELEAFVATYFDLNAFVAEGVRLAREIAADPSRATDLGVAPAISQFGGALAESLAVVFGAAIHIFITLVIAFYLLRDDHRIAAWARGTVARPGSVVERYLVSVDDSLATVFFGNILNALLTGMIAAVTYLLLNLIAPPVVLIPEAALLGLLVGAASLVPVIGIKLVTVPLTLYLAGRSLLFDPATLWFPALFTAVSFVVVDYIPDQLLRPYVSGRTLHVGAVILAYTIGPLLFGWYGIFLGPLLLVLGFEFGRQIIPWLLDGEPLPGVSAADTAPDTDDATGDEAEVPAGGSDQSTLPGTPSPGGPEDTDPVE
jgi:predicted PurR-regulated permease PerM